MQQMMLLRSPVEPLGCFRQRTCRRVQDLARHRPHHQGTFCAYAAAIKDTWSLVEDQRCDTTQSWDEEQLEARRQSHANSSTSDAAGSLLPGDSHTPSSSPALLAPPRLPRAKANAASTAIASQHVGPPRLSDPAQEQVFPGARIPRPPDPVWQGSVTSRIAVLGRALLALPKGASAGVVLRGEMLSSKQITQLLSWLGREGRSDVALAAFDWLEGRPEYVTGDCHLYTRLISIFGRLPNGAPAALGLFERMCQKGIRPDRMAFNCSIGAAGKAGDWGRVKQLHEQLQAAGIRADVWTFSALFLACQSCGNRWQDALALHRDMEAAGIKSNVVVFTTLMNVCQRAGEHERAIRLFRTMEAAGLSIDVMAYNQAMASCSWEQAWSCMQSMRIAGVQPNTRSYNALLAACERDGEADRALEAFARMEREAPSTWGLVEPSLVTFNTLISACGKAGKYDEALQLFAKMGERGLQPDNFTVCSMITAANKAGRWRAALHLFRTFCEAGGRPNVVTYNALIKALSQCGQLQRALAVFNEMRGLLPAAGSPGRPPPAPNLRTWTTVIVACHAAQAWPEVLALHRDMRLAGVEPDSAMLQTVISACEKVGAWEQADQIFHTMEARGLLRDMGSLAAATRRMLYALPTAVSGPLMTSGHLALDSGRAARRWIDTATLQR